MYVCVPSHTHADNETRAFGRCLRGHIQTHTQAHTQHKKRLSGFNTPPHECCAASALSAMLCCVCAGRSVRVQFSAHTRCASVSCVRCSCTHTQSGGGGGGRRCSCGGCVCLSAFVPFRAQQFRADRRGVCAASLRRCRVCEPLFSGSGPAVVPSSGWLAIIRSIYMH